jgi:hypothetical protein
MNAIWHHSEWTRVCRTVRLCSVEPGDVLGDIELVLGLDTYIQSIECSSKTTVYYLSRGNLDRLLGITVPGRVLRGTKLAERTQLTLVAIANHKLDYRIRALRDGVEVPLFNHLLFELNRPEKVAPLPVPEVKAQKELPDRETLFYHVLQAWLQDKAALLEPAVPGGTYYKQLTRDKARERNPNIEHAVGAGGKPIPLWLKAADVKQRHPRTVKVGIYETP